MVLGAVLLAIWYAAVSQGNSGAYLLMFFLASLVMVSAIHAHFALTSLSLRVGRVDPVFAGEPVRVPVEVTNGTRRPREVIHVAPNGRVFHDKDHVPVGHLHGEGTQTATLALPTDRRGRMVVPRLALTTVYPMGFFRAWRYEPANAEYLVYPRPHGSLPLPTGPASSIDAVAGTSAGGDDYAGVRPYQTGESQRHVDWRAVARGQELLVKQFSGAGSRRIWLRFEDVAMLPDLETRLSQLSKWIVEAEAQGYAYGLQIPGFETKPALGTTHRHRCLAALALYGTEPR